MPLLRTQELDGKLKIGLILTFMLVIAQVWVGLWSNSLALLSDAAHNLSDVLASGFGWVAVIISRRAPTPTKTYGYRRAGILAASLNSLTLILISAYILYQAVPRLLKPPALQSWLVVEVAAVALIVNLLIALFLRGEAKHNLNSRSVFVHLLTDVLASFGVILAGLGQAITNWPLFDPVISILIALLILWSSWGIIKEATNVLLEASPARLEIEAILTDLNGLEGVREVHDLHVWTINSGFIVLSCHLQMESNTTLEQVDQTIRKANLMLEQKYQIYNSTLQIEDQIHSSNGGI